MKPNFDAARKEIAALTRELKREGGSKKDFAEIARQLDKIDAAEFAYLMDRSAKTGARFSKPKAKRVTGEVKRKRVASPRKETHREPELIGARELRIRGFWDRYPKSEQREHSNRFKHIPADLRRGPTAYDLLLRDYLSFTPLQRKRLQLRVAYGVLHETGTIITDKMVDTRGLAINLSTNTQEAMDDLATVLIRAGLIYTPVGWDNDDDDASVPLGIEWWLV